MADDEQRLPSRVRRVLDSVGGDYRQAGRKLHLPAGLVYMIRTGLPADGSHAENTEATQQLVNPPAHNPTSRSEVHQWLVNRALGDHQMQQAGGNR